jgi:hypothetical protein
MWTQLMWTRNQVSNPEIPQLRANIKVGPTTAEQQAEKRNGSKMAMNVAKGGARLLGAAVRVGFNTATGTGGNGNQRKFSPPPCFWFFFHFLGLLSLPDFLICDMRRDCSWTQTYPLFVLREIHGGACSFARSTRRHIACQLAHH